MFLFRKAPGSPSQFYPSCRTGYDLANSIPTVSSEPGSPAVKSDSLSKTGGPQAITSCMLLQNTYGYILKSGTQTVLMTYVTVGKGSLNCGPSRAQSCWAHSVERSRPALAMFTWRWLSDTQQGGQRAQTRVANLSDQHLS